MPATNEQARVDSSFSIGRAAKRYYASPHLRMKMSTAALFTRMIAVERSAPSAPRSRLSAPGGSIFVTAKSGSPLLKAPLPGLSAAIFAPSNG
jgi:hypothetical protein